MMNNEQNWWINTHAKLLNRPKQIIAIKRQVNILFGVPENAPRPHLHLPGK